MTHVACLAIADFQSVLNSLEMLHLLLSLPPHLMGSLVLSKLELSDLVRLDSALLVKECLRDLNFWYNTIHPVDLNHREFCAEQLEWLFRRGVRVENLLLDWNDHQLVQFVAGNIQHVSGIHLTVNALKSAVRWDRIINLPIPSAVAVKVDVLEASLYACCRPTFFDKEKQPFRHPFCNLRSITWQRGSSELAECKCFTSLIRDNPMLSSIKFDGCFNRSGDLSDVLQERRDTLRTLNLSGRNITHSLLQCISECCTALTMLHLQPYSPDQGAEEGYRSLILGCPLLESITTDHADADASSAFLAFAMAHGHRLVCLHACPIPTLCDDALLARAPTSAPLRELTCAWGVTSVQTVTACKHALSQMTKLNIRKVNTRLCWALRAALHAMPCLTALKLNSYRCVANADVLDAVTQGCTKLQKLQTSGCIFGDHERALVDVIRSNPALQELDIYSADLVIQSATLLILGQNCSNLKVLRLCCNVKLTDAIVVTLAQHCRKLSEWDVGDDSDLTDTSVLALVDHCRDLKDVSLPNATQVREQTVVHLVRSCRKLIFLLIPANILSEATLLWLWQDIRPRLRVNIRFAPPPYNSDGEE